MQENCYRMSGLIGGRGRNRTYNLSIKSRMLCQLSYASGMRKGLDSAGRQQPGGHAAITFISRSAQKVKAMPPSTERSACAKNNVLPSGVTNGV